MGKPLAAKKLLKNKKRRRRPKNGIKTYSGQIECDIFTKYVPFFPQISSHHHQLTS
jgi:hypothetical protein